ncbi:hypothetical protein BJX70DRAFT_397440 [Aspergillus crustosus]
MLGSKASLVLASLSGALAQLSKPVMSPAVPFYHMDAILYEILPSTVFSFTQWEWGTLPARCKSVADNRGINAYDINVYEVTYDDCDTPWVFCRHHDAQVSLDQMIDNFGRLPVRLRDMVRTQIAVPSDGTGAYAYSDLGDIVYTGNMGRLIRIWIHEIGHVIDRTEGVDHDYSSTDAWLNEYNQDSYVCDKYGQSNNAENFAEETLVALFDKVVPGGINSLAPNSNDIYHQYTAVQKIAGDRIIPGGTCSRHFADDRTVCMGPAAGCESEKRDVEVEERGVVFERAPVMCEFH